MTTAQALFDFTIQTNNAVEEALHFRARMGHRGFLEVPEPKVIYGHGEDGLIETVTIRREPFIWHTTMPEKTTRGGRASFYDLTDEATVAQVLAAKEGR